MKIDAEIAANARGGINLMLRLPVIAYGAEHLVMGYLMRRNIMVFKAPPMNDGYDLICIHPERPQRGKTGQVRVQVKSRCVCEATGFPLRERNIEAFDFLVMVFMNAIAKDGHAQDGWADPEFFTLPQSFIRQHHKVGAFEKVVLKKRGLDLTQFKNEIGFELIAEALGVARPCRIQACRIQD